MVTTLTTGARNAACNAIVDLVDVGATDLNGDLRIYAAGDVEVAILAMSQPAFDDAGAAGGNADGVATADPIADDTNATGGTAIAFILQDRNNAEVIRGDVATSGAELNLSSTAIGNGDTVSVSSLTVTVPAT